MNIWRLNNCGIRAFQTTSVVHKKQAGRQRPTRNHSKPLTYEQSQKPSNIFVTKNYLSWNTAQLLDGVRQSETSTEDFFIRKFMVGTWHRLFLSEIIIKRRGNLIIIG